MGSIGNIQEPWHGHTGLEVETFIKSQLSALASLKFGRVEWDGSSLTFYDEEGGSIIQSVSLGGEVYTITVDSDLGTAFYVLGSETTKVITLTPTTEVGSIGSSEREPFPEAYTLAMAIDNGSGYRPIPLPSEQSNIPVGGSSSIDLRPYVINGNNYIRFTFTGLTSGQVKSMICTATVTSLQMSCNHTWQTPWEEGQPYTINGIRFAGSLEKVLHIAVDGTEVGTVPYSANQSYTTTATSYTIAASYFPADSSGVHTITLWMTATGVSTPVIPLNIMCVMSGSTTPLICINAIANKAVNFTAGQLFAYAVYNAEYAKFNVTATMGTSPTPIPVVLDRVVAAVAGTQYPFTADLQIESEEVSGTLTAVATALDANQSEGASQTITMSIDNTYSYIATSGALFYMNPANRSNDEANHEVIINEGTPDQRFAASYNGVWSGLAWSTKDGWATDPDGHKCLAIPAGGSLSVPTFAPLGFFSSYDNGMTVELMIQPVYPSDYDTPILTLSDAVSREGITIYPTKIVVLGSNVAQENRQMVNICENRITHLTVTFMKNYAQQGGSFNLCSIYVNGTSNICYSFGGDTAFGNGSLSIGAPDVDTYIYKMRVYGKALEARDVLNNFLNCVIDGVEFTRSDVYADNDILDGGVVDYEKTKAAGYNTMVITMDSDSHDIPSYNNNAVFSHCKWRFEYAEHPEWNVTLEDVELDGQGTTSKQYYRWNLRDKHSDNTRWLYDSPDIEDTTGKKGYFAGTGYPKVDRITAKKNYASSMQGHKMGMTGLYDDLFTELGLKNELPSTKFNVAVYQFPFVGFRYYEQSGAYEFIGIYTAGPDKGSKVTFGYSSDYPNCLSLEGPNHNPLGTRFLVPWVDMAYDPSQETLTYGGQEGWDCDYVKFETSTKGTQTDWDNIMGLYESEWKPAYEIVYHCSPYIASIQETGYVSLAAINADIDTFLEGTTNGVSNALMSFYDTNYDLCFYRISTGRFDTLTAAEGKSTFNLKTYLGLTGSPTTTQIKTARAAKFKSEWGNYWSVNQTIFHYCYCVLFGVTDNFAKNSYPVKFRGYNETLGTGESAECKKWGWRQDDLDTVFITDNNGMQTKKYSVEHGDLNATGAEVFQGGTSVLWVLIRDNFEDDIVAMMKSIANAAQSIASDLGITGNGLHGSLFNVVSHYCWEQSSKYFACTLYEDDRTWSYITPWLANPSQQYNGVYPLTQALGDQYQAERLWVERRIAYIFSRYGVGLFSHDITTQRDLSFTLGQQFRFRITPAIDLYPVISQGSTDYRATRTEAGDQSSEMVVPGSDSTTVYVHGGDWISSLGDLHAIVLAVRGGDTGIDFSVTMQRIQELIIGGASGVTFNATTLTVESPTIKRIDARNTVTIINSVSLMNCPRLREVLFAGSGATGLELPVGSKVETVSFPDNITSLYLNSLAFLVNITWPGSYENIRNLYVNDTPNVNALTLLEQIMNTTGNKLEFVTLIGDFMATASQVDALGDLAAGDYGRVVYDNGSYVTRAEIPDVQGTLDSDDEIDSMTVKQIRDTYVDLDVIIPEANQYVAFKDPIVDAYFKGRLGTGTSGYVTLGAFKTLDANTAAFTSSHRPADYASVVKFNEYGLLGGTYVPASGFNACTSLEEIILPETLTSINGNPGAFTGCPIKEIHIPDSVTAIGFYAFQNCTQLKTVTGMGGMRTLGSQTFPGCTSLENIDLSRVVTIQDSNCFNGCSSLKHIDLSSAQSIGYRAFYNCDITGVLPIPNVISLGQQCFYNNPHLTAVTDTDKVTTMQTGVFYNCTSLSMEVNMPSLTSMGHSGFYGTAITKVINLGSIPSIGSGDASNGTFMNCQRLTDVHLPSTLTSIGTAAFRNCKALETVTIDSDNQGFVVNYWAFGMNDATAANRGSLVTFPFEKVTKIVGTGGDNPSNGINFQNQPLTGVVVSMPNYIGTYIPGSCFKATGISKFLMSSNRTITRICGGSSSGGAFSGCTSLTEIQLPTTVTIIEQAAFENCSSLVTLTGTENITSLATYSFSGCSSLKSVNLNSVTNCDGYVFKNCGIETLNLPALTSVGNGYTFQNMKQLKHLDIGPNPTGLGDNLCYGCSILETFIIRATTPPTVNANAFGQTNNTFKIYVPYSADHSVLNAYQTAQYWSGRASQMYELNQDGTIPE